MNVLSKTKQELALTLLRNGASVRQAARVTRAHQDTIRRLRDRVMKEQQPTTRGEVSHDPTS
jgi:hypothetical protein